MAHEFENMWDLISPFSTRSGKTLVFRNLVPRVSHLPVLPGARVGGNVRD